VGKQSFYFLSFIDKKSRLNIRLSYKKYLILNKNVFINVLYIVNFD